MKLFMFARRILPESIKSTLIRCFPFAYRFYNKRYLLSTLKLKRYYEKKDDSLHIGKTIFPMSVICSYEMLGIFIAEYADIVQQYADRAVTVPYYEGPYEIDEVKLEKGDVVFDCGANIGVFSAISLNHDCVSYAFEPLEANIALLNTIIKKNPGITLEPYAISDKDGSVGFTVSTRANTAAKIQAQGAALNNKVNSITIDTFVEENGIKRVDFIKADIEGAERLMLKGAKKTLARFAPKLSLCTYHYPDDPQVMRQLILEANPGYRIIERYKKMYAYVPKEHR